jgi:membrane protease YdiL (CAAX protease family)
MKLLTKESSPTVKILMSIAILMSSISFTSLLFSFFKYLMPVFSQTNAGALCLQAVGSIFMFGLSAWLCILLFSKDFKSNFTPIKNKRWIIWAILIPIISIPFNDWLQILNDSFHFSAEEIFRQMQVASEKESERLLTSNSFGGLLAVSFVLALIPAVVEELFFRGVIQNYFNELCKNSILAIILTSVFFSLMHFEIFSFLPRFVLSCFLGYLFIATKNLIIPIICHFINNFGVCLLYFLHSKGIITTGNSANFSQIPILIILSVVILVFIFVFETKKAKHSH